MQRYEGESSPLEGISSQSLWRTFSRSRTLQYSLAIGSVAATVAIRMIFAPFIGPVPYLLFIIPTIVTANLAGRAPALVAAVLGGLAAGALFMPPGFSNVAVSMSVYALVSAVLVSVIDSEQRQRTRAESALRELRIDITERKRVEESLRESEFRERARASEWQAILDAVPAIIFIARDPECRQIVGSRATYDLLRLPPGSNLSKTPGVGEAPSNFRAMKDGKEIPAHELPMQKACSTRQPIRNYEFDFVFNDGSRHTMLGDAIPTIDESGRTQGVVAAFMDITEHKLSEEGFRHAQKLESIGLLAGGIAHDYNNLLASIMGYASLLKGDVTDSGREKVEAILQASQRAADLTRQLLAYAGRGRFIVQHVDLSKTIHDLAELLYASIPKKVYLKQSLAPDLPAVDADPGQIQQIIMNLILNAAEAIPANSEGTVSVQTSVETVTAERTVTDAVSREPLPEGQYVCLEVTDTGTGMDEAMVARIFDPFFTTKFAGRGLGLAAVGGVVKAHRGAIQVSSSPGNGSTFRILLPAVGQRAGDIAAADAANLRGSGTVLVVDDEEMLRKFTSAALEQLGYRVLTAKDGRDAIRVFEESPECIDVILLDLTMPVMSGQEAWDVLKAKCPAVQVILMSGYGESDAAEIFGEKSVSSFLQKPFPVSRLAEHVQAALHRRAPGKE